MHEPRGDLDGEGLQCCVTTVPRAPRGLPPPWASQEKQASGSRVPGAQAQREPLAQPWCLEGERRLKPPPHVSSFASGRGEAEGTPGLGCKTEASFWNSKQEEGLHSPSWGDLSARLLWDLEAPSRRQNSKRQAKIKITKPLPWPQPTPYNAPPSPPGTWLTPSCLLRGKLSSPLLTLPLWEPSMLQPTSK